MKPKLLSLGHEQRELIKRFTIRPQVNEKMSREPNLVLPNSKLAARKAVEEFARYFRREMNFDFVQYSAAQPSARGEAWLLPGNTLPPIWVGAAYFIRDRYIKVGDEVNHVEDHPDLILAPSASRWTLNWIWLHPFFRAQGVCSTMWVFWEKRYGAFGFELPISGAMRAFLKHKKIPPGRGWLDLKASLGVLTYSVEEFLNSLPPDVRERSEARYQKFLKEFEARVARA